MCRLRKVGGLAFLVLAMQCTVWAQETPNPTELKKQYDEAVGQLKAAQDRKNELAAENEKLQARVAELETRLAQKNVEIAGFAERTWILRAQKAAWDRFIDQYPGWKARWEAFLSAELFDPIADVPITAPASNAG